MTGICPACLDTGKLKYSEKIDPSLFNSTTYASRKRPELMHYALFECGKCKTLFTNRDVNLDELLKNYDEAGYDSSLEAIYAAKTYVSLIRKYLPEFKGTVLDIGAGDGAFLSKAKKFFANQAVGIEPSKAALEVNSDQEISLFYTSFETYSEADYFDMLTCFQTIEHLNDPVKFLDKVKIHLKSSGYFVVTCHNNQSFVNRLLGEKSPIFDVEHLQIFSKSGIEELFKKSGFEIVVSQPYRNKYPLSYWARLAPIPNFMKNKFENSKFFSKISLPINVGNHFIVGKKVT